MTQPNWIKEEFGGYYSHHENTIYLGDPYPTYHVLENPDGDGWVIGMFYSFIGGEYVPLEEPDEEPLIFDSAEEAMRYVDETLIPEKK